MKFDRFLKTLTADEAVYVTGLFNNYIKDRDTPYSPGDDALIREIAAKAEKVLPESPLRKFLFAVIGVMKEVKRSGGAALPIRRDSMDIVAHSKAATSIRDFLLGVELTIRRDKFPFLTPSRFAALLREYTLSELLRDGIEHKVLKNLY